MSRDQRRAFIEEEMGRRGLPQNPLWVEQQMDALDVPAIARARGVVRSVIDAGRALRGFRRTGELPASDMLLPPDNARYAGGRLSNEWTAVELDRDTEAWLDRVYRAAPVRVGNVARLDAWLTATDLPDGERRFAVHIGDLRVGLLERQIANQFIPMVDVAGQNGELAMVTARLAKINQLPYLLVVRVPLSGDDRRGDCVGPMMRRS